ncbi:hypothetical protein NBO_359g0008 [Nosema bombycis CQ1]|uniref:Uncharacterized protein n=1 Tax=Nosema bombycis (strain CQ1 / CVCC 102059) TaxID=578461 RepID=R0M4E2_NOSB1|nr:hypothetical protein NBO_359g0008 [Nosema bombycis CQ1]|eukprot:EOB12849.1 hypothetical protein NBO_359g0008 [Nosema bombycis CQ1]
MRIYLIIVLLCFITAPKTKETKRVKSKDHSSKKQSSVSKNKGKTVELEESSGKITKKKQKSSKKSSSEDKKEKRKVGETKEKKKSAKKKSKKKKTKKREGASEELKSEKIDVTGTKSEEITPSPSVISPAIIQNDHPATSESPSSNTQTTFLPNTIPKPRSAKPPITTDNTPSTISSILASMNRNKLLVNRTTNSTIATTGTQPNNTTASINVLPNNV